MLEGPEFVDRIADRLGVERLPSGKPSPTQLAKAAGLPGMHAPQNVTRWVSGRNGPAYEGTILLLDAAGFLTQPGREFLDLASRRDEGRDVDAGRRVSDRAHEVLEAESEAARSARRAPRRGRR